LIAANYLVTGREFYIWRVRSCTVRLALDAVQRLSSNLSDPRINPNEEVGGILFGSVHDGSTQVTGYEFFRSEHRRGLIYDLGARERAMVARYVAAKMRSGGDQPVGYFRTHLRPGLFLDQDDFALMSECFAMPHAVALLIGRDKQGRRNGGFFFWQGGDIDRHKTHLAFPFDAEALAPLSERAPELQPKRAWSVPRPSLRWVAAALVVPAALAAAVVALHHQPATHVSPQTPAVVVLPATQDRQAAGSTDASQNDLGLPAPPAVFEEEEEEDARPAPARQPVTVARNITNPGSLPRVNPAPQLPQAQPAPAPAAEPAAPAPAPVRVEPPPKPVHEKSVLVAIRMESRINRAEAESSLRKIAGHVPLLGHPFRRKDADFTPAHTDQRLEPRVPRQLAQELNGEVEIDVRVAIDPTGAVTNTQLLRGSGTTLGNLAAASASSIVWQPAKVEDRPIPSEMIIHYFFRASD